MMPESKVLEWHYAGVAAQRATLSAPSLEEGGEGPDTVPGSGGLGEGGVLVGDQESRGGGGAGDQPHRGQEKRTRLVVQKETHIPLCYLESKIPSESPW